MNNTTIYLLRGIPFALYFIAMIAAIIVTQSGTPLWALFLIDWVTEGSKNIFPINKIKAEPENPQPWPTAPQGQILISPALFHLSQSEGII